MPLLFQRVVGLENRPISADGIRHLLTGALAASGITGTDGKPLTFWPHDFRRVFTTDAILNGMPPHIAQLILGHEDINTTMGYKAAYPEEAIRGHRAFIAQRRAARPSEEYRTPTDAEWDEFLGHFQRRRVALGDCGRAYSTPCIHEHAPHQVPPPAHRPRPAPPPGGDPRQPPRPHRRSRTRRLDRRSRRTQGQPRRRHQQTRPGRRHRRPPGRARPPRHPRLPRHRRHHPHHRRPP